MVEADNQTFRPTFTGTFTAFEGTSRLAAGSFQFVRSAVLAAERRGRRALILVFNDETGAQTDLDFRPADFVAGGGAGLSVSGPEVSAATALAAGSGEGAESPPETRRAGRPKLGVVGREVTLLPRHWEWLAAQPGGASVALRKLVESARKLSETSDLARERRDAAYRFMVVLAGNLPGFEEASRALFAGDRDRFERFMAPWPADVRDYTLRLLDSVKDCIARHPPP